MRILSRADVERLIDMEACIQSNLEAYVAVASGRARVPVKHHISVEGRRESVSLFMPGYLMDQGALGMKVVSVFPENRQVGLPTILGAILLISPQTGEPLALLDGTWLTSFRTGGGSGAATQVLARPDARRFTLLGTGGMALHQVEAVLAVRPVEQVMLWNRTPQRAERLALVVAERVGRTGRKVKVVVERDRRSAVAEADIITVCTSSVEPVLMGAWVKPGAHVNLVGSHTGEAREGDDQLLEMATLRAVDAFDSAAVSGEVRLPLESGRARREDFVELGAVVTGRVPGRQRPDEITWFKSMGLAAQDMACAALVFRRAVEQGVGTEVAL